MKLSARLQKIADYLPQGCKFADIGSDHALLPVAAVLSGRAVSAVAGEVNDGPFEAAGRQVESAGLTAKISVRKGNGLAVVQPGEVNTVTIAGMGGALIATILSEGEDKLSGVQRLILQPNVGEDMVRRWLLERDWVLTAEEILEEDGKIYEILVADRRNEAAALNDMLYQERELPGGLNLTREWLIWMGPMLSQHPADVFFEKWESELDKLAKIRKQMGKSDQESARQKEAELDLQMSQLKEVLACLRKVRL
ncbi:tRNA (adenine(22)-N(1))-methyltransferase [Paenibacillus physcomitrellae]|uniref:SAM-dependent methyltransferase n=1 Tax=Paenibacillus physcomitrellae TaxID=1619311 RepID=A0ABQ1FKX3_9BACL|nr:tRNA (adenine(22)-N(1))-methyltransferase TrmK [Paenibacillus physcomitrellae]GGA20561.1 SAM-dependent methyltransferase [Paenibacillus physcomitrellae]